MKTNQKPHRKLVIFGKYPLKGFSKTRLAEEVGEEKAMEIYHHGLYEFFTRLEVFLKGQKEKPFFDSLSLWVTPKDDEVRGFFQELTKRVPLPISIHYQEEKPFFLRLSAIFDELSKTYPQSEAPLQVHLTGTDLPDFPLHYLDEKDESTYTLGPDEDGGFYYFKGDQNSAWIFEKLHEKNPKREDVFQTLHKLVPEASLLKPWSDIDTLEDFERYQKRALSGSAKRRDEGREVLSSSPN